MCCYCSFCKILRLTIEDYWKISCSFLLFIFLILLGNSNVSGYDYFSKHLFLQLKENLKKFSRKWFFFKLVLYWYRALILFSSNTTFLLTPLFNKYWRLKFSLRLKIMSSQRRYCFSAKLCRLPYTNTYHLIFVK